MVADAGCPDGLYHQDTRFLSQLELRLNGDRPLLLSSNRAEDNRCCRSISPMPTRFGATAARCSAS